MKQLMVMSFSIAAMASSSLIIPAVAVAAPTGPSSVDETVNTLKSSGYNVIVNRTGDAPLAECAVRAVRAGQTHSTDNSRGGGSINTTVTSKTVYVDVTC